MFLLLPTEFFLEGREAIKKLSYKILMFQDAHLINTKKRLLSTACCDTVYSKSSTST